MDSANCGPCGEMEPETKKSHMASDAARKGGKARETPQKEVPKGPVCAPKFVTQIRVFMYVCIL